MSEHPDSYVQHVHSVIAAHITPVADSSEHMRIILSSMNDMYQHSLRHAFNAVANPHHCQPAIEVAQRHGLNEVAGDYLLPKGLSAPVLETYAMVAMHVLRSKNEHALAQRHLHDLRTKLEQLNPVLKTLVYDRSNIKQCYDTILGVTSGFHTDDIQFYLDGNFYKKSMENPVYAAKHDAVVSHFNDNELYWVPSPKTMDRILAQQPRRP